MAHRSQKAAVRILSLAAAALLAASAGAQTLDFTVRHERALKDRPGRVSFDGGGVRYTQTLTSEQEAKVAKGKKPPKLVHVRWAYDDIQQLWLSPDKLVVLTYKDRKWLLGADQEYEFYLAGKGQSFLAAYEFLKDKLDQRLIAAVADSPVRDVWEMPAKLLGAFQGSEGVLQAGDGRIVFKTDRPEQSRTWRLEDIENVSTSGPYQLTITTYERAKTHYGSRKGFNFQLKRKLDPLRYDTLWRSLNRGQGLKFLTSMEERNQTAQ